MVRACRSGAALLVCLIAAACQAAAGGEQRVLGQLLAYDDTDTDRDVSLLSAMALDQAVDKPMVVTLGDSVTMFGGNEGGWVTRLAGDYGATADVFNKGVGMGNANAMATIAKVITQRKEFREMAKRYRLVTLSVGVNDASIRPKQRNDPDWRFVPLANYTRSLSEAIDTLKAAGVPHILLITPPPASPVRVDRSLVVTGEYAAAVKALGAAQRVPVVDLYSAILAEPDWVNSAILKLRNGAPDGLHLTLRGNAILHDLVLAAIEQHFPGIAPSTLRKRAFALRR